MTRNERRVESKIQSKRDRKIRKEYRKTGGLLVPTTCFVTADMVCGLKSGDKITIKGVRYMKNGMITSKCKAGNETVLTVR
jgi:hypothetical protein